MLLTLLIMGVISVSLVAWYIVPQLPDIDSLRDVQLQVPLRVYTEDGQLIAEYGEKRRTPVNIDAVPDLLVKAFLAAEDDRFYQHPGVDWQGILRAAIHVARTGDKSQGGSTITMQVARNFFLSSEKTYLRKINEIFLALKIERELSKDEVLELYLNKIYLGQRAYGIAAAAQVYYGLPLDELTLAQMATIAGLPKAPSTTNPVANPGRASDRRTYVLDRMLQLGFIDKSEYESARATPVAVRLHQTEIDVEAPYVGEMVRQQLVDEYGESAYEMGLRVFTTVNASEQIAANSALRKALHDYDERHGYRGPEQQVELPANADSDDYQAILRDYFAIAELEPALVTAVGEQTLTVHTRFGQTATIDWDGLSWARKYISTNSRGPTPGKAADIAAVGDIVRITEIPGPATETPEPVNEATVDTTESPIDDTEFNAASANEKHWRLTQVPAVEGALIALDPHTGATRALVGGYSFARSSFNRVIQAQRQPGSAFKPFIYSAAMEAGYTPASIINDAPVAFTDASIGDVWRPKNYSGRYYGPTRLREALVHSRNLVSIRLLDAMGVPRLLEHLQKFGFAAEQFPENLSLSLGSGVVTPHQLARAYTVFANGGYLIEPYFIERIEDAYGVEMFVSEPKRVCPDCDQEELSAQRQLENDLLAAAGLLPAPLTEDKYAPQTLDPQVAWLVTSMTQDVIRRGTGARANQLGRRDLAGKTGTTNDQRDAWFAGYNHDLVAVSWVGFDNYEPLGNLETGGRSALPMWIDFMKVALDGKPESELPRPPGLINARIDPDNGKLARPDDPDAIFEVFPADSVPTEFSREQGSDVYGGDNRGADQLF
ncbi:MAG: penicillin-binding protein 1A [Gammaproteobacteria bacterium]